MYWLAVSMVAVFGIRHVGSVHGVPGCPIYLLRHALRDQRGADLRTVVPKRKGHSVHSIYTRRREIFYWAAVLTTFAMGTAVGDMTAVSFHFGFFASGSFLLSSSPFRPSPTGCSI